MGKHYVPQEYLRGFSDASDARQIHMFDKVTREWSRAAIKQVAQEGDYYPADVEERLAKEVENPGNAALESLRAGQELTSGLREALSYYIAVMIMRGPRKRRLGYELAPKVLSSTVDELRASVQTRQKKHDSPRVREILAETDRIEAKFGAELPSNVEELIRAPWPSSEVIAAVDSMVWRFARAPADMMLITTDSPAFFFESYGVGTEKAELTFPIDANLVLLGSHQGSLGSTIYFRATPALIKEANRRLASGAERFVFSRRKQSWIETLASRTKPYLSRIEW